MNRLVFFLFACLSLMTPPAFAAECDGCDRSLAPRLWIPDGDPAVDRLPLKSSHAEIRINGPIAEVEVTQRYGNAGTRALNARYVFPGSTRAAVHGLTMKIGDRLVRAQIKEKAEAARVFEAGKREGKRAALLEQQRPNVFSMDVANIMPGDEVELTLRYSELLVPEEGVYELVYPTVAGPRYGADPLRAEGDAKWIANPYAADDAKGGNPAATATGIRVALSSPVPVRDLHSEQHKINTRWENDKSAQVTLDPSETQAGNRDFVLRFRLAGEQILSGLMTYRQGDENYFLMMAQPPRRVAAQQVMRREYLFVVDVSGSMHGFPLDTARHLMGELLGALKPQESFNILFFSGGSRVLSPEPLPATPDNVQRALAMMQGIDGGGGTELLPALQRAFAMPRAADLARSLVVVTDGFIGAEREAYDLIRAERNRSNLFAFGIGSSVNRHLLEGMAHAGAGEPFVVTSPAEAAEAGARFRRYIQSPLLGGIAIRGDGVELYDLEPAEIPVMLAERPIVVFGKYRGEGKSSGLEITGQAASGEYRARLPLAQGQGEGRAELLPTLWARHRLMRIADLQGTGAEANRDEIVRLGLAHSILTSHTSFVAVDEVVANPKGEAQDVQQPLPLPQGVSELALAPRQVPEPELYWLGMLMVLVTLMRKLRHACR